MASSIDIANLALGNIRAQSINAFDEASIEAQVCDQRYDLARQFVLRDNPWRFANKIAALALVDETAAEWSYVYDYPTDCLAARHIVGEYGLSYERTAYYRSEVDYDYLSRFRTRIPFEVAQQSDGSRAILCDLEDAYLAYTADVTDTTQFQADFIEALAWYLAAQIAVPIVGSNEGRELRKDALQMYSQLTNAARANDANEAWNTYAVPESPTITARR